jgi:hypothetical protein
MHAQFYFALLTMLKAPATMAGLCLGFGVAAYFGLRNLSRIVSALSRGRSHLFSVGAGLTLLVLIFQVHPWGRSQPAGAIDENLPATADPYPASGAGMDDHAALTAVITYHNDNARTGQYIHETVLTPANVNPARFGKLYSYPLDGYVYAQPLYMPQVAIPGNGIHNVVVVATEHDSVYAFDADSSSATPLWRVNFLNPDAGITTLTPADVNASDIVPEIGITSTPVIDVSSNTIYVVAATKENGAFYHRLHALDLASGAEKFGGPQPIQATYPGAARESSGGVLAFDSRFHLQRAALLLDQGRLYVAFASYGDFGAYHGWVIAYDATTLKQTGSWVTTPNGYQGGIWMSGCGISADADGNLYLSVANGPFDAFGERPGVDVSDSVVKLKPGPRGPSLLDYFTPFNQARMARDDLDLGSAGVVLLPDQPGSHPHLAVTSGKNGHIYVLNRDALGGYRTGGNRNPQLVQEISGLREQMGTPAYWNGYVYFGSGVSSLKDSIRAFPIHNGMLSHPAVSQTQAIYSVTRNTVSVSANGNRNGIVWAVQTDGYYTSTPPGAAVLRAYDASNLGRELYNSNQRLARDNPGPASKFTVPTIANGKVFVGTANQLSVYGLLAAGK